MPYIPPSVAESAISEELAQAGLKRVHQGKVRDTYAVEGYPDHLLVVATDRISIFDFVLGALVPKKGEVLTALTVYFLTEVLAKHAHHLVAFGSGIDEYLPLRLRNRPELQVRALVVIKRDMMPVECVVRGVLTGSAWEKYKSGSRNLWGYQLPDGLIDGAWLEQPMYTPTDKAESGHDEPVTREYVVDNYGLGVEIFSVHLFDQIRKHAREKGIIFADTKFEFDMGLMICDEIATPDSSRYWDADEYRAAQALGKAPGGYDKQPVREWGKQARVYPDNVTVNIGKLDAKSVHSQQQVGNILVPAEVLEACTGRYLKITQRLVSRELSDFQRSVMKIEKVMTA
ncbi:MAG: phosphoribosylaminoimidazolesuccinocarboxamide synthase [Candidatus Doudnabacteria bacterium]